MLEISGKSCCSLCICLLVSTIVRDHMNFIQFREDKLGATKRLPWRYVKTCFTVEHELLLFYPTYKESRININLLL